MSIFHDREEHGKWEAANEKTAKLGRVLQNGKEKLVHDEGTTLHAGLLEIKALFPP